MVSTIILAIQMCRHGFWGGHQRRLSNSCTERSLKQAGALALERNGRVFRSLPPDPDCLQTNFSPVTCHTQHEQFDSFVEYTIAVYIQKRSEVHTSELQSLKRISYAVLCLKQK